MTHAELLGRVSVDPNVCGGQPYIRETRIYVSILLDSLAEASLRNRSSITTPA